MKNNPQRKDKWKPANVTILINNRTLALLLAVFFMAGLAIGLTL